MCIRDSSSTDTKWSQIQTKDKTGAGCRPTHAAPCDSIMRREAQGALPQVKYGLVMSLLYTTSTM